MVVLNRTVAMAQPFISVSSLVRRAGGSRRAAFEDLVVRKIVGPAVGDEDGVVVSQDFVGMKGAARGMFRLPLKQLSGSPCQRRPTSSSTLAPRPGIRRGFPGATKR